jgi:hypothetical protein
MIKACELRLHNFILKDGRTVEVMAIMGEDNLSLLDRFQGIATYRNDGHLQPIPLTEEWLLKLGFFRYVRAPDYIEAEENHPLDFAYPRDLEGWIVYDAPGMTIGCAKGQYSFVRIGANYDESTGLHIIGRPIEYIHQLQNLYFAITGEELTIKKAVC